ncbi:MAG TPA: MarR family winged helix-turn-helix transcriptional regulator [Stellaceae bacterium]|jgi:DNA-binding MarR family transcriptional regulator|nr:MarR family winged helix-turn-helix transcriptional regulator [Stellaceae bacterium]
MTLAPTAPFLDNHGPTRSNRRARAGGDAIDLGPLEALIGFQIHLLDLLMYQIYYERFGKAAMTPGMFSTLCTIKANPGVRQGALADALLIQRPNMTLLVNRLIRASYVRRRAARGDNRGVELFLRAEGERALSDVAVKLAAHEQSLTAALTKAERERLAALLAKIVRHLRAAPRSNGSATTAKRAKPPTR